MIFNFMSLLNLPKYLFTIILLSLSCLILGACSNKLSKSKSSTSSVDIFIQPSNETPLISLGNGKQKICRRGERPHDTVFGLITNDSISDTPQNAPKKSTPTTGGTNNATPSPTATKSIASTKTAVGNNWFKLGLLIVNKRQDYWLIIENLKFIITAQWGNKILRAEQNISAGYCDSDYYLYIVSPTSRGRKNAFSGNLYQPYQSSSANNYINNLTLYVSGIPIPTGPAVDTTNIGSQASAASNTINKNNALGGIGNTIRDKQPFVLNSLPPYTVQLLVTGRWIDKNKNDKGSFTKLIRFALKSRFIN